MVEVQALDADTLHVECREETYEIHREDKFRVMDSTTKFDLGDVFEVTEMDVNDSERFPSDYMLSIAQSGESLRFIPASAVGEWLCEGAVEKQ